MKYLEFYNNFKNRPLIDVREVKNIFPDFESRRFYEWQKKGYIKKLSKLFYIFVSQDISESVGNFIANKLVEPSYISLEQALKYYAFIPEEVYLRTSVTTRKTRLVATPVGDFQYRSIKEELFFGYQIKESGGLAYKIAEPEKALLDFLYLRRDIKDAGALSELRINEDMYHEMINQNKLEEYLDIFDSETLRQKVVQLHKLLKL